MIAHSSNLSKTLSDLTGNRKTSAWKALQRILKQRLGIKLLAPGLLSGENMTMGEKVKHPVLKKVIYNFFIHGPTII